MKEIGYISNENIASDPKFASSPSKHFSQYLSIYIHLCKYVCWYASVLHILQYFFVKHGPPAAKVQYVVGEPSVGERTAVHEIKVRGAVIQQSLEGTMIGMEPEPVPSYSYENIWQNKTMSAVLDWLFLVMELYESAAERYAKKVVELLHCDNFDIDAARDKFRA